MKRKDLIKILQSYLGATPKDMYRVVLPISIISQTFCSIMMEAPYEVDIRQGKDIWENSGYGTGFGDLWGWTYFGCIEANLEKLKAKHLEEKERVATKYPNGKRKEETFIAPMG